MNSTNPYLFHVGRVDEAKFSVPTGYEQCRGYTRQSVVDRTVGSVHMGVSVGQLAPDGEIARCVNAYEKGLYILSGELELQVAGETLQLKMDDYFLVPFATPHALRNTANSPVHCSRWRRRNRSSRDASKTRSSSNRQYGQPRQRRPSSTTCARIASDDSSRRNR